MNSSDKGMLAAKRDYILAFLYANKKEPVESTVRLMKLLFLFKEKMGHSIPIDFYEFQPYLYGPCSFEVYKDLHNLRKEGLISVKIDQNKRWEVFHITETGERYIEGILGIFPESIEQIKNKFNKIPFMSLLRYVYSKYPYFAKKSIIDTSLWGGVDNDISSSTKMH